VRLFHKSLNRGSGVQERLEGIFPQALFENGLRDCRVHAFRLIHGLGDVEIGG
jgi:hypothetical protein